MLTFTVPVVLADDFWITKEPIRQARAGLGVAEADGKIYAIGEHASGLRNNNGILDNNEEYSPATGKWFYSNIIPKPRSYLGIVVVDNKIYCIGGWTENNETSVNEVYDPATGTWETRTSMLTPRHCIEANAVNGKIYVSGGRPTTNMTEVYDPATNSWTTETPKPYAVSYYASSVVNNKIYIIGGQGTEEGLTQIYDPQTGTWRLGAQLQYRTYFAAAAATTGAATQKRIYVLGGTGAGTPHGANQIYTQKTTAGQRAHPCPHHEST